MTKSAQGLLTLQREGELLIVVALVGMPISAYVALTMEGAVATVGPPVFMIGWIVWFFAWASKGGVPPRGFR